MVKPVQAWQREATMRYLTDPLFHSKVQMACQLTFLTAESLGLVLTDQARASVLQAASYGALVNEISDEEATSWWSLEEIEANMQAQAENFGFSLGKQEIAPDVPQ